MPSLWYRTLNKNRDKHPHETRNGARGLGALISCSVWLMLGLFNFLSVNYADCLCLENESKALLALKDENQLDALSSWKEGSDCCRGWAGVSCDTSATHVVALKLTVRSQLSNVQIPKTDSNVKNNSLSGRIPSTIGTIGNSLQSFTLSYNGIEGSIPSTLGDCVGLTRLDLSHNNLSGTLPSTLENLSASLRVFTVGSNRLSGPFPAWIISGNFTSLQVIDLSNNSFYGELTADYSKLSGFVNGTNSNNDTLYDDSVEINAKGITLEIAYIVTVRTSFDVSS